MDYIKHPLTGLLASAVALFLFIAPSVAQQCSIHDHNCFHGTTPFDPRLDDLQTGTGDLTITSRWNGEAGINLHVGLPDDVDQFGNDVYGPFLPSNPDGNPVTATPLGK